MCLADVVWPSLYPVRYRGGEEVCEGREEVCEGREEGVRGGRRW